jgi:hypothetical protein
MPGRASAGATVAIVAMHTAAKHAANFQGMANFHEVLENMMIASPWLLNRLKRTDRK